MNNHTKESIMSLWKPLRTLVLLFTALAVPNLSAVDIDLSGEPELLSGNVNAASMYRFPTDTVYKGEPLDLILEVTGTNNGYNEKSGTHVTWDTGEDVIRLWTANADCSAVSSLDGENWLDLKATIVKKGTFEPVVIDTLVLSGFEIDTHFNLMFDYYLAKDYLIAEMPQSVAINSVSKLRAETIDHTGTNGVSYGIRLLQDEQVGRTEKDCIDAIVDPACTASLVYLNRSSVAFRTYTVSQYTRMVGVSFSASVLEIYSLGQDYGDAPESYGEAYHDINQSLYLGRSFPDAETTATYSQGADSDDAVDATTLRYDDDDGVTLNGADLQNQRIHAGGTPELRIEKHGHGYLFGWIDFNRDGVFGDDEKIADALQSDGDEINISVRVPARTVTGVTYARFRYGASQTLLPEGDGGDGEVEDYRLIIEPYCMQTPVVRSKMGKNQITWQAETGAASYALQRSLDLESGYETVVLGTGTFYLDRNIAADTLYYYRLKKSDAQDRTCDSDPVALYAPAERTRMTTVPALQNTPYGDVSQRLHEHSLLTGDVESRVDETVASGEIISHAPPANSFVPRARRIDLVVSDDANATFLSNNAPVFVSTPVTTLYQNSGKYSYSYTLKARDVDGDTLTFALQNALNNMILSAPVNRNGLWEAVLSWKPDGELKGFQPVSVEVTDARGAKMVQAWNVFIDYPVKYDDNNSAPVIHSSPVQEAFEGIEYRYAVDASDPDGDAVSYKIAYGPTGMKYINNVLMWTPSINYVTDQSVFEVEIFVVDCKGGVARQSWQIHVGRDNLPPIITSVPVTVAYQDSLYDYAVVSTDPEGDYQYRGFQKAPDGMYVQNNRVRWTPTADQVGAHEVVFRVRDTKGAFTDQNWTINVKPNRPPIITSVPVTVAYQDSLYDYAVVSTDPEGDYQYRGFQKAPDGMYVQNNRVRWTPTADQVGAHEVVFRVRDTKGAFTDQNWTINVNGPAANHPPVIKSAPIIMAQTDTAYQYTLSTSDADNDPLDFELASVPLGMEINASGTISWTPAPYQEGWHDISIRVSDDKNGSVTQNYRLAVVPDISFNHPPVIKTVPVYSSEIDKLYTYDVNATDNDDDTLTYRLDLAPSDMTIDALAGVIRWTPDINDTGWHDINVSVTDAVGATARQHYRLTVVYNLSNNHPPVIRSELVPTARIDARYVYDVNATDSDGDTVTYSLDSAPEGMIINGGSGHIEWLPAAEQAGYADVNITVADSHGAVALQRGRIAVVHDDTNNRPPVITSVPPNTVEADNLYRYEVVATDADADPLSFSLDKAPQGMEINATSGLVTWIPKYGDARVHYVVIRVSDGLAVETQGYYLVVAPQPNQLPYVSTSPSNIAWVGQEYRYDFNATDPNGDALSFALMRKPDGMVLDEANQSLTWTPTASQYGFNDVLLRISDPFDASLTQSWSIAVTAPDNTAPRITSAPYNSAFVQNLYVYDVMAEDDQNDTLSYSLLTRPEGMSIDPDTGTLTWTPALLQIGVHTVKIRVMDDKGAYADQSFNLTVTEMPEHLSVELLLSSTVVNPGESVTIYVNTLSPYRDVLTYLYVNGEELSITDGRAVYTAQESGLYEAVAVVSAPEESAYATAYFTARDPNDTTPPEVELISPEDGGKVTFLTEVIGSVYDDNLAYYRLSLKESGSGDAIVLTEGHGTVDQGTLGSLDPTLLRNGLHTLTLTAVDTGGYVSSAEQSIFITGDAKIGHFSFSVIDFNLQLSGLPVILSRTYDTRVKHQAEDIGYGWSLDVDNVRLQESRHPGKNWRADLSGNVVPTYCYRPDKSHQVAVMLPGSEERFELAIEPECGHDPHNFDAVPVYRSLTNSGATLTALDVQSSWRVDPNTGRLLETGGTAYNPDRYRLTTLEGTVYEIEQFDGLQRVTDMNGQTLRFTDDGVYHSLGYALALNRDAQGRVIEATDPEGNRYRYDYDDDSNLESVIDPEDHVTQYRYDGAHTMTEIIDPEGTPLARNEYDESGRLVRIIDAEGNAVEYDHDIEGREELVTDALGHATRYLYDEHGNVLKVTDPLGHATTYTYDADDNKLSETNALGETTTFSYTARGHELTRTDPLGHTESLTYDAKERPTGLTDKNGNATAITYTDGGLMQSMTLPGGATLGFAYDAAGNKIAETDERGRVTSYAYDAQGNKTLITYPNGSTVRPSYDANGRVTRIERTFRREDNTTLTQVETKTYDALGRVIAETDARGLTSRTVYDAKGRMESVTDEQNRTTRFTYDLYGNTVRTDYADGTFTTAEYDAKGNVLNETDREGQTTLYEYDAADRLIRSVYADGGYSATEYDQAGRTTKTTDENGNSETYTYDAAGNRIGMTDATGNKTTYTHDAAGNRISMTDAMGNTTYYEYNSLNQQVGITYPDGSETYETRDFIGLLTSKTDENGNAVAYGYDYANGTPLLNSVVLPGGIETRYAYDERSRKTEQTDALQHTTRWGYTDFGEPQSETLPMTQTKTYTYDAYGRQSAISDYANKTTRFIYDSNDRVVRIEYEDGSSVTYGYTPGGMLASVTDVQGTIAYTYDERGRLKTETKPDGETLTYGYDNVGNITLIQTADRTVAKTYDKRNRLKTVTDETGTTTYDYDALGRQTAVTYPNGATTHYGYDSRSRVTSIEHRDALDNVLQSFVYTLDRVGNRITVVEQTGRTVNYTYDTLNRLTGETVTNDPSGNNTVTTFTYDDVGNMLTKTVDGIETAYVYNNNDQLIQQGASTFTYDDNGNLIQKENAVYVYDAKNRLVRITTPTDTIEYAYGADDNRIAKSVNGEQTDYLIDGNTAYAQVFNETSGTDTTHYTYGNDLINRQDAEGSLFYHTDALGSTRALTDADAVLSDTYAYTPYGELIEHDGTTPNDFLFTGEQFDPETQNYYLRARYYDPGMSRFLQRDSWNGHTGKPITLNHYAYANGNPMHFVDYSGNIATSMTMMTLNMAGLAALSYVALSKAPSIAVDSIDNALEDISDFARTVGSTRVGTFTATLAIAMLKSRTATKNDPKNKIPIQQYGTALPMHQLHIFDAMVGLGSNGSPTPNVLTRLKDSEKNDRNFLRWKDVCGGSPRPKDEHGGNQHCDEYPYNSSLQGGTLAYHLGQVSVRLVPEEESRAQGRFIKKLYDYAVPRGAKFKVIPIGVRTGFFNQQGIWIPF